MAPVRRFESSSALGRGVGEGRLSSGTSLTGLQTCASFALLCERFDEGTLS